MRRKRAFADPDVKAAFAAQPHDVGAALLDLRELIFDTAARTDGVGALQETLKWRQPSYLTPETGSGTTIRIDALAKRPGHYALYFHCQSGLVEHFRALYPDSFEFEGKRALILEAGKRLPEKKLRHCIALALTHHLRKSKKARS
ncbi:MAG: DUF1801 domain-containing protein [Reyranellaceae bacterium]